MRTFIGLFVALSLVFAVSAPAVAQENAGEDEYTEGVPGGGGETPGANSPGGSPGSGGSPLPSSIASQFEGAGADGAAAAELAESGGPSATDNDRSSSSGQGSSQGNSSSANTADDGGFAGAVKEILNPDSDSGLGIWLPVILGLALLTALIAGISRFRNSRTPA